MHDVTYANEIIRAVNERLKTLDKGSKIAAVNVSLSIMSHVKPETLAGTFKAVAQLCGAGQDRIVINMSVKPGAAQTVPANSIDGEYRSHWLRRCHHRFLM